MKPYSLWQPKGDGSTDRNGVIISPEICQKIELALSEKFKNLTATRAGEVLKPTLQISLPVTSRPPFDPSMLFRVFADSFKATVSGEMNYRIYLGIDDTDEYYLPRMAGLIYELTEATGAWVLGCRLEGLSNRICAIWETLAMRGYRDGCDCYLLAGDDVQFLTPGWDLKLCEPLMQRGYGIEAFNDIAFPNFPTFPVLHRSHFDCFKRLLPDGFAKANQYGDPFLYQVYQMLGAARINSEVKCNNTIGGAGDARYRKMEPTGYDIAKWAGDFHQWKIEAEKEPCTILR